MLKSIEIINRLHNELIEKKISGVVVDFFIELRVNQKVNIYIVSGFSRIEDFEFKSIPVDKLNNKNLIFKLLPIDALNDDRYSHYFDGEVKVSLGLRRSLNTLLNKDDKKKNKKNVLTFFSYKGGVGRTTSLALTATYLARKGKNVFVIDCDFEAPGLLNFFNSSQSDNCKSGLIEYLNDVYFDEKTDINDYIYNIEKKHSGSGVINLMPAGNILSSNEDLLSYLEGVAKIDLQADTLVSTLTELVDSINEKYSPDIIIVDSRTGFNNILGALSRISKHMVFLAGDDVQNQPGIEYFTRYVNDNEIESTFVLSILSANYSRRFENFNNYISSLTKIDTEKFYFDRQNALELIGTPLEDSHDIDDFINGENGSPQYHRFFNYMYNVVSSSSVNDSFTDEKKVVYDEKDNDDDDQASDFYHSHENRELDGISIQDTVLSNIRDKFPDLYAENIDFKDDYVDKYFYFRPCMEDLLIPEKNILLGDKGTGKTAFYKALQLNDFFQQLVIKSQKTHLNYKVLNVTNIEEDNFQFLGFDGHLKDELFIRNFWLFFIWNAFCIRGELKTGSKNLIVKLSNPTSQSKIISIISKPENMEVIVNELDCFNNELKKKDERLVITFDQLDNMVKPMIWNDVISPLLKMVIKFPYENIHPKLFLRRDLYDRLANITNKNSFTSKIIDLEWSQNEIFSYFLKIVFVDSKDSFFEFLSRSNLNDSLLHTIKRKIKTRGKVHNQLPLDKSLIEPVINCFFGFSRPTKNKPPSSAYEDLYRNIQSADKTVNLRPFIDLIINAIKEQDEQDLDKGFRGETIIGLAYCTSKNVRKNAVVKYLEDLWNEQGNEFVRCFCIDFSKNKMNSKYKRSNFYENVFDELIEHIKLNNTTEYPSLASNTVDDLKQILIATKIITPYLVGNSTRYRIAYLYTNYLGL